MSTLMPKLGLPPNLLLVRFKRSQISHAKRSSLCIAPVFFAATQPKLCSFHIGRNKSPLYSVAHDSRELELR